jgi:hypothetical protein
VCSPDYEIIVKVTLDDQGLGGGRDEQLGGVSRWDGAVNGGGEGQGESRYEARTERGEI